MSTIQSEMKVPIRPAPPPPVPNQKLPPKSGPGWNNSGRDIWSKSGTSVQKKKPPPRPPPPKFANSQKKSAPSRPSQLIADLFHRKNHVNSKVSDVLISKPVGDSAVSESRGAYSFSGNTTNANSNNSNNVLMLIDFSSPPSSPTFTTRSSSDALSVNSFGSDGVTQCSGSSGNASNVESGFEDDFDVFSTTTKVPAEQPRDPWSPPPKVSEPKFPSVGKANSSSSWATFPSPNPSNKFPQGVSAMPTIIRSKPEGPKAPGKVSNSNCDTTGSSVDLLADVFRSANLVGETRKTGLGGSVFEEEDDDGWSSESPPMPTCPPPAPPPEILNDLLQSVDNVAVTSTQANGIALYDYDGELPDDLSFKKDDIINLVRRIDENWYVGEKDGREGSVPANFLSVRVPLRSEGSASGNGAVGYHGGVNSNSSENNSHRVVALYAFRPETWEDLELEEGSVIEVTHRIDQDWLYGESNGKRGQFPANFVDRVPGDLPYLRRT